MPRPARSSPASKAGRRLARLTLERAQRELLLGMAALAVLVALGTAGYALIERWNALDAFYMTFITLSTIGFSEVHQLSPAGKLFTVALATVGIGTFATIASRTIQLLVSSPGVRERLMQRRIAQFEQHYVICGYGRLGQRISRDLQAARKTFVVVDRREDRVEQLTADGYPYVAGDATEDAVLHAAGIDRAAGLVLVLPDDAANVFVALTAREARGDDLFIVARTNEQAATNKLLRAGADKVISPLEIGADRIAQTILRPRVDHFMEHVLGVDTLDFDLEEVLVEPGSALDGLSLLDVDFRRRFDAIVVAVFDASEDRWRFNPDARVPLAGGDTLVVLTSPEHLRKIVANTRAGSVLDRLGAQSAR